MIYGKIEIVPDLRGRMSQKPQFIVNVVGSGPRGESATIRVGNVTVGDIPSVKNVGTEKDAVLDFTLPGSGYFVHTQNISSDHWIVIHNMNRNPSVTVVDTAGSICIGEIDYDSLNQLTLKFSAPFSGKAYLN